MNKIINFNGSFKLEIIERNKLASKAMYGLICKCRKLGIPTDLQIELFHRMIVLIMQNGCEVLGPENYRETEILHLFKTHFRDTWKNIWGIG